MGTGLWKDEQRSPGPWPQGRRRPWAILATAVVAIVAGAVVSHARSGVLLGGFVILIALGGFYTTARLDQDRLDRQRYIRGPGWLIGLAISKLPLAVARLAWLALSLGILALGIAAIAGVK